MVSTPGMKVKEFRPDLVILDVMLPDINGKEVCQRVPEAMSRWIWSRIASASPGKTDRTR
jgi:DNA-binding response OmpR family regulator